MVEGRGGMSTPGAALLLPPFDLTRLGWCAVTRRSVFRTSSLGVAMVIRSHCPIWTVEKVVSVFVVMVGAARRLAGAMRLVLRSIALMLLLGLFKVFGRVCLRTWRSNLFMN